MLRLILNTDLHSLPSQIHPYIASMKWILVFGLIVSTLVLPAQVTTKDTADYVEKKVYLVVKHDGTEFVGQILKQDAREVLIRTATIGDVYIPKHEIKEIREVKPGELKKGQYWGANPFTTRYFVTTNGLQVKKGEHYAMINLWGPEAQFAVADKWTVGVMTSWVAIPVIGTVKYSHSFNEHLHVGAGALIGTGSWADFGSGGAVGFGALTIGDDKNNINLSAGYAAVSIAGSTGDAPIFSVGGTTRLGKRASFVFDSFIYTDPGTTLAILIPGVRFDSKTGGAFQFGFAGLVVDGDAVPVPVPMVNWFIPIGNQ